MLTGAIIWVLVLLSVSSPRVCSSRTSPEPRSSISCAGSLVGAAVGVLLLVQARRSRDVVTVTDAFAESGDRETWRMPAFQRLERPTMSPQRKIGLLTLRGYLAIAFVLVIVKIVEVAVH